MNQGRRDSRLTAIGTIQGLASQALMLSSGILISVFLTRKLGPGLYGLLTVSGGIVLWLELSVSMMFTRTAVKFISGADDWREVAGALVRIQVFIGLVAGLLLAVAAPWLALLLGSSELTGYLRLFAVGIPLHGLGQAHIATLVGRGAYGKRALASAAGSVSRLVLVIVLVGLGLSVPGAILASIGATVVSFVVARFHVRPPLLGAVRFPWPGLWGYVLPLFGYDMARYLFRWIDLFAVKALVSSPAAAGYYGAAQNLSLAAVLFATSFTPLLLSTLTRMFREERGGDAQGMTAESFRVAFCFLPLAGMVAASAPEIISLLYGREFLPAASLVRLLVIGSVGTLVSAVAMAALTAAGRPNLPFLASAPLPFAALGAHLLLVPRFGAVAAAADTAALSLLSGAAMIWIVKRVLGVVPTLRTALNVILTTLLTTLLAWWWPAPGAWVLVKLMVTALVGLGAMVMLGEVGRREIEFFRSLFRRPL